MKSIDAAKTHDHAEVAEVISRICAALGLDPKKPPLSLSEAQVSEVLMTKPSTLRVWRCTKRYPLPYLKMGRNIKYPLVGVAEFLLLRTHAA